MYLKIKAGYCTHILRVTDVRNVYTGIDTGCWAIYVFYRCGADSKITIRFDDKKERDEACEKIYQALVAWEGTLE